MKTTLKRLFTVGVLALLLLSYPERIAYMTGITVRTLPGPGSGCSNNGTTQTANLVITPQGVSAGDALVVWITEINTAVVTSASVSGTGPFTATVNYSLANNADSLTMPSSGGQARISGFTTAGYNTNSVTLTGSTSSSVSYTVGSSLASCASTAACGTNPAVTVPVTLNDNADTPNTYNEIVGAFVPMTDGQTTNDAGSAWTFLATNIVLHGGVAPIITIQPGNSSFIGGCVIGFAGLTSTINSTATNFYQSNVTSIPTPSIQGTVQPELFVANSYINGGTQPPVACGGNTFTSYNPTDQNNGQVAGFFISSATGAVCAGLNQNTAAKGAVSIASIQGVGATGSSPAINKKSKILKILEGN